MKSSYKHIILAPFLIGCSGASSGGDFHTTTSVFPACMFYDGAADGGGSVVNVSAYPYAFLLTHPHISLIFWGKYDSNVSTKLSNAWKTLAADHNFWQPLSEYGIGDGSLSGVYYSNTKLPVGPISEVDLQTELKSEISNGTLPQPDSNSLYAIMLPSTTTSTDDIAKGYNGHHYLIDNVVYSVVDYNTDINVLNIVLSHEIHEAATDSYIGGYSNSDGQEIGDLCQGSGDSYMLDSVYVQKVWSQTECRCIP